jgi:hypothetical protein
LTKHFFVNKKVILGIPFALILLGVVGRQFDPQNSVAFIFYLTGWLSSLIVVGYFSTPSNSLLGKICFGFVIVMTLGVLFKMLHFLGGNELIVVGLIGVVVTYGLWWFRKKPA